MASATILRDRYWSAVHVHELIAMTSTASFTLPDIAAPSPSMCGGFSTHPGLPANMPSFICIPRS